MDSTRTKRGGEDRPKRSKTIYGRLKISFFPLFFLSSYFFIPLIFSCLTISYIFYRSLLVFSVVVKLLIIVSFKITFHTHDASFSANNWINLSKSACLLAIYSILFSSLNVDIVCVSNVQ